MGNEWLDKRELSKVRTSDELCKLISGYTGGWVQWVADSNGKITEYVTLAEHNRTVQNLVNVITAFYDELSDLRDKN